jgi:hypothetical protein
MPRRKQGKKVMVVQGAGFFDDLKKGVLKLNSALRRSKIISNTAGALSAVPQLSAFAGPIHQGAKALGYGKRRAPRKRTAVKF